MHLFDPECFQRPAVLAHGPGELSKRYDLLGAGFAETGHSDFSLRAECHGFLMIGNTEGLLSAGSDLFETADKKQKIYRKKLVPTPITFGFAVGSSRFSNPGKRAYRA